MNRLDDVRRRGRAWSGTFSLRSRVGLLVAAGVGLAVALTSVAAYVTVRDQLHRTARRRADRDVPTPPSTRPLADPDALRSLPSSALGAAADLRIALLSSDGNALTARGEVDAPPLGEPELAVARGTEPSSLRTAEVSGSSFRVVAVPTAAPGVALVLAQPTDETDHTV